MADKIQPTVTAETLRHQRDQLRDALGRLLVAIGAVRADEALSGPELLLAAEVACSIRDSSSAGATREI